MNITAIKSWIPMIASNNVQLLQHQNNSMTPRGSMIKVLEGK